jgi:hypothetical protein
LEPAPLRLGFVLLALSLSTAAAAQLPTVSGAVDTPSPGVGHDYIENNIETVNPATGTVSIRMGITLPKQRGFNIPFNYTYASNSVFAPPFSIAPNTPFFQGGWSLSVPTLSIQGTTLSYLGPDSDAYGDNPEIDCPSLVNYVFQGPTGHRDNLGLTLVSDLPNCSRETLNK